MSLRIVGGASFPGVVGALTVTWPLASLTTDSHDITVDLRSRILKRLFSKYTGVDPSTRWWTSDWEDVSSVECAYNDLVLRNAHKHECRFVVLRESRIDLITRELGNHGVSVTKVS